MIDEKKLIADIQNRIHYWESEAAKYDEIGDTENMDICDGKAIDCTP